jgi:HEPN domain-containing protein
LLTRFEEYNYLLERSRRFLETAEMQFERGFHDLAVFSLEQALQLYLKACLLKLGVDYPRTHSVRKLLELTYKLTGAEEIKRILTDYAVELGSLEDAYIMSRYVAREYSVEEAGRLRQVVTRLMEVVGGVVNRGG